MGFMTNTDWSGVKLNRVLSAGLVECRISNVEEKTYPPREARDGDKPDKVYYPQEVLEASLVLVQNAKTVDGEEVHAGFPLFPRFRISLPTDTMKANGLGGEKDLPENIQTQNRISRESAKKFLLAALALPKNFNGDLNAKVAEGGGFAGLKDKPLKVKVSVDSYGQKFDDFFASNGVASASGQPY